MCCSYKVDDSFPTAGGCIVGWTIFTHPPYACKNKLGIGSCLSRTPSHNLVATTLNSILRNQLINKIQVVLSLQLYLKPATLPLSKAVAKCDHNCVFQLERDRTSQFHTFGFCLPSNHSSTPWNAGAHAYYLVHVESNVIMLAAQSWEPWV